MERMVGCTECGATVPRSEAFGAEGDFLCADCAAGVRRRYERRGGGLVTLDGPLTTTLAVVALALSWVPFGPVTAALTTYIPGKVWDGQLWRLLTDPLLVNFGVTGWVTAIATLYWFWRLGGALEAVFRAGRYAALLAGAALLTATAQFLHTPGDGPFLTGVVFAFFGFLFLRRRDLPAATAVMSPLALRFFGLWAIVALILGIQGSNLQPTMAQAAGLFAGVALGWATQTGRPRWLPPVTLAALLALTAAGMVATAWMEWNPRYCFYQAVKARAAGDEAARQAWYAKGEARLADDGVLPFEAYQANPDFNHLLPPDEE